MGKYRSKHADIDVTSVEAVQWFPGVMFVGIQHGGDDDDWSVDTSSGPVPLVPGDWIVTHEGGHRWTCKPDVFAGDYEAA